MQRIEVTISDPGAARWGFQLTARPASSLEQQAGSFRADGNAQVVCDMGNPPCSVGMLQFPTHTLAGTRRGTRNSVTFAVEWTAPSSNVGNIIFAGAGNAANNNDAADAADNIYFRQITVMPAAAGGPTPTISTGGVIGAGLSTPAVRQISANGIISVFGENFAPAGTARLVGSEDLVGGRLPANLAGVCVQVGDQMARMFHVFPNQLNIQVPTLAGAGNVPVQVITSCGGASEVRSNSETVVLQSAAPEFFFFARNADGRNPIAAINAQTFGLIGAPNLIPGATFTPARPSDIVALFATGLGRTNPAVQAGELPPGIASTVDPVTVMVGSADAEVLYAGVAPGLAGLYQINIRIPASAADGDQPVTARIGSLATPAGAFLTVRR